MTPVRRWLSLLVTLVILCSAAALLVFLLPPPPPVSQPETDSHYAYYLIVDETDQHHLMYVPLKVNIGDEVLTENNLLYRVIRLEGNLAYARLVKKAVLP